MRAHTHTARWCLRVCGDSSEGERVIPSLAITVMIDSRTNSTFDTLGGLTGTCVHTNIAHKGLEHFHRIVAPNDTL